MTTKKSGNKKITIQDIIEEGKKPIRLEISGMGYLEYIYPTSKEFYELEKAADKDIMVLRERHKMEYPNVLIDEKEMTRKKGIILSDLTLWKGLNKADNSVTMELVHELPNEIKSQLNMKLSVMQIKGLGEKDVGDIKNLLEMTKDSSMLV